MSGWRVVDEATGIATVHGRRYWWRESTGQVSILVVDVEWLRQHCFLLQLLQA